MTTEPPLTYYSDGYQESDFPSRLLFRPFKQDAHFDVPAFPSETVFSYQGLKRSVEVYRIKEEGLPEVVCGRSSLL